MFRYITLEINGFVLCFGKDFEQLAYVDSDSGNAFWAPKALFVTYN